MGTVDKYRVQLDFTPDAFAELEKLKADVGAASRAETVRYAMRVLRWLIKTLKNRSTVFITHADGTKSEVEFPFLPHEEAWGAASREQEGRDYVRQRAREAREQQWGMKDQQKEKFRAAFEAGRRAYEDATRGSHEDDENTQSG